MTGTHRVAARPTAALLTAFLATAVVTLTGPAARADGDAEGVYVTVANPITSEVTNRVKERVDRAVREHHVRKVIFDFNPDNREANSPNFGPCSDLADYILDHPQLVTVAFVHGKVCRHTVLPVLACKELVMSREASVGEVPAPDEAGPPRPKVVGAYKGVARPAQEAIVMKMLDRDVEVIEGRQNGINTWYLDRRHQAEAAREGVVVVNPQPVLPAGSLALLRAPEALKFGLCKLIKETPQEVLEAYDLPPSSLREDPLQGRAPAAWRIDLSGPITPGSYDSLKRRVRRVVSRGANVIFLQLDGCGGGETESARDVAEFLRTLHDERPDHEPLPVVTVAFVPHEAPDTAAFVALGCSEIVMAREAKLGDFGNYFRPPAPARPGRPAPPQRNVNADAVRKSLEQLAQEQGYSPLVIQGLFDRDLEVYQVRSQKGPLERKLMTAAELDEDARGEQRWQKERPVKAAGQLLELTAGWAKDLGIARYVVDGDEMKDAYAPYGLEPNQVRSAPPDWLDGIATFLGDPVVSVLLVMVGIGCLILELKMPGVGLPGVIAALCFVLFFWAHSQLNGQITVLAVLLFLLGLVLIGIEVFLVPGMGVLGVSGVLLLLVGLGLATVEHMPQTSQEWVSFGGTLTSFGLGLVGAAFGAFFLARYLPNIPYANRLVLTPPGEKAEGFDDAAALAQQETLALLGAIGTAATMLRPAGMARFGDAFVDVVTEGGYVPAGARVQVVEIEGNRIVVKEV
jgi:membrane-bound ClpP family serine protease